MDDTGQHWLGVGAWLILLSVVTGIGGCGGPSADPSTGAGSSGTPSITVLPSVNVLTLHPGDQNVSVRVGVNAGSYGQPIVVTATGLPSGVIVSPLTLTSGNSGTLFFSASVSADQEAFSPADVGIDSAQSTIQIVAAAGQTQASAPVTLTVSLSNPSFAPAPSAINLPIVEIETGGQSIDVENDVPGTFTVTSADGGTVYDNDTGATFHLHGNSTAAMPKKPYHVKLGTSIDLLTAMGLSCPYVTNKGKAVCDKSKSYILLANYDDKTLLRDWAASALANAIPMGGPYLSSAAGSPTPSGNSSALMPWAPHSLFVELYVNGAYQGNYQLIEEVKIDANRVNIPELSDSSTDTTGGYLMEIDDRQQEDYDWITSQGVDVGLIDPDYTAPVDAAEQGQEGYITAQVQSAENALFGTHFTDPATGWRAWFDEAAAVNFYIVNDLMGNEDGAHFFSSDYLYKNADSNLIYMGPVWDFDISAGNVNYDVISDPTVPFMQIYAPWYVRLFQDSGFESDVATQWNALKSNGIFSSWLSAITTEAQALQQSQTNNFSRWPMLGIEVWPNAEAAGSYSGELTYLLDWLNLRIAYLDSAFNNKSTSSITLDVPGILRSGTPATLTAHVTGSAPTGTVYFLVADPDAGTGYAAAIIGSSSVDADGDASLTTSALPAGSDDLKAVYSGDSVNALSSSDSAYATVEAPLQDVVVSLSSSATSVSNSSPVTLAVSVIPNSGTTAPTGTVTFSANGAPLGTASLSGGEALFTTSGLSATTSIQAVYGGDTNYHSGSSPNVSVTVRTG